MSTTTELLDRYRAASFAAGAFMAARAHQSRPVSAVELAESADEQAWALAGRGQAPDEATRALVIEMLRDREREESLYLVELVRSRSALRSDSVTAREVQAARIGHVLTGRPSKCLHPIASATYGGEWEGMYGVDVPLATVTCGVCNSTLTIPGVRENSQSAGAL